MSERLTETEHQEPRRRARSGGSRATSATTGSSEDGSSGQHADYDTEVSVLFSSYKIDQTFQNFYNIIINIITFIIY